MKFTITETRAMPGAETDPEQRLAARLYGHAAGISGWSAASLAADALGCIEKQDAEIAELRKRCELDGVT